ncbi:hypothetical protein IFM89_001589 [Coptis chinensis]|uniref:Uncharacterized protein n=1 Tax=Coptis chinensis TaxID=261450 RepID=A0A835HKA5_9MAGN|nr:hypothetical protein IFM89_001589 [Coptis chinensis]
MQRWRTRSKGIREVSHLKVSPLFCSSSSVRRCSNFEMEDEKRFNNYISPVAAECSEYIYICQYDLSANVEYSLQLLEKALNESEDLDSAIKSLNELRLGSVERDSTSAAINTNLPTQGIERIHASLSNCMMQKPVPQRVLEILEKSIKTQVGAAAVDDLHKGLQLRNWVCTGDDVDKPTDLDEVSAKMEWHCFGLEEEPAYARVTFPSASLIVPPNPLPFPWTELSVLSIYESTVAGSHLIHCGTSSLKFNSSPNLATKILREADSLTSTKFF